MADETLTTLSATELAGLIRRHELSPVELLEATLARLGRVNPVLNAVVTLNPRAMDEARSVEARLAQGEHVGPLGGLPVGIKDVTPVGGLRTTYGSPLFGDHVPSEDAIVVRRFRESGAIILGKTNCPEFAAGGNTFNEVFGRTRNPWNTERSAGGSTGGGAAALATGMVAVAEGTDLGGSLRIPASFCGVVGLRPSVGRVPTVPEDYLWDTLQVTGPMARTAEDVALALQAIAGATELSPLAQPDLGGDFVEAVRRARLDGLRLAYCGDIAGIGIDAGIEHLCREAAFALTEEARTEEIELDLSFGRPAFLSLRGLWFVSQLQPYLDVIDQFGANVANNLRAGLRVTPRELASAEIARRKMWDVFRDLFTRYDGLLTPCMAVPPFPVEENYPQTIAGRPMETYVDWIAPTFVLSLTGLPVASVPCGLDADGLPVGLQVVGPPRGEQRVLALARAIERIRPIGVPPLIRTPAAAVS
jgi:amidase